MPLEQPDLLIVKSGMMMKIKQVLVVRKDLKMRKGKIAAQCAHASLKVFLDRKETRDENCVWCESKDSQNLIIPLTDEMKEWLEGIFTKVCVSVDSEEELLEVYKKAQEAELPCALVTDAGLTEFHGIPTNTVVAIGPANEDKINEITGELKLL